MQKIKNYNKQSFLHLKEICRYKNFVLLTIVIIIVGVKNLTGQEKKKWNLQQCIEYAYNNNITIKQRELNTKIDKYNLIQSYASIFPEINAGGTHVYNYGQTIDRYTNQFATQEVRSNNFYIQGSLILFQGFYRQNLFKQNTYNYEASKYETEKIKNDIALNIASAYLQILFSKELVEATKTQLESTKLLLERTEKLFQANAITEGTLLDIKAQYATEELQLVNAENQTTLSLITLAQMLDISPDSFDIEIPPIIISEKIDLPKPEDIYSKALNELPQIKAAEFRLKSSEKMIRATRGLRYPALSLQATLGTGYSGASKIPVGYTFVGFDTIGFTTSGESVIYPKIKYNYITKSFSSQLDDNFNKSIGLYLTIPLFNGLQTHTNIQKAKINFLNAQYNLEQTKNQLKKEIEQAYADAIIAEKRYHASIKTLEALEESYRYMQKKFEYGIINSTDYNIAKSKLIKAKADLLQAKYDYIFKIKVLDFYMGKPISLN